MSTKDITPVRIGDRWIDDGATIELWSEDGSTGVSLEVEPATSAARSALRMVAQVLCGEVAGTFALVVCESAEADLQIVPDESEVPASQVDLDWLRSRLDPELLVALTQRSERLAHVTDRQAWKVGDAPRAAVGSRVSFADLFPHAWDLVATYHDRSYALIDRYLLDRRAEHRPCEIEVIDLATGAPVGSVETTSARRSKVKVRQGTIAAQRIVQQFRDGEGRRDLRHRAEEIARVARRLETWSDDLRDPAMSVGELLRAPSSPTRDLRDRVDALGVRAAPALRDALAEPGLDRTARCAAARLLARLGEPAGIPCLVEALRDRERDNDAAAHFIDAMRGLGTRAIDPVLAVLEDERDPEVRALLLEGLLATRVEDDRIAKVALDDVRRDVFVAELIADYGYGGAAVVEGLSALLAEQVRILEDRERPGDEQERAYGKVMTLAEILEDLEALDRELEELVSTATAVYGKPRASSSAEAAWEDVDDPWEDAEDPWEDRDVDGPVDVDVDALPVSTPVRVAPRPGRNDPCRCGSGRKYKKCHWAEDEVASSGRA